MGRKSLAEERSNQILDAFEQSIIAYGFEGATLQRIADSANVNLGMIHHYIGRKDDLLKAMVTRLIDRVKAEMVLFEKHTTDAERLPLLLTFFFEGEPDADDKIVDALYSSGRDNTAVQEALDEINQFYADILATEIQRIHPALAAQRCKEIGTAVLGLAYSSTLLELDNVRQEMWRETAEIIINNP